MKPGKLAISLMVVMLFAAIGYFSLPAPGPTTSPDITLVTTEGEQLALDSLRGRPLLVTFWATTCTACLKEMPHLIELYKELAPRGLKVIGIAMHYDPPNQVLAMRKSRNIPYTIALDIRAEAAQAFGDVRVTPSTFLIAPDGRIVYRQAGALSMERLKKRILALLDSDIARNRPMTDGPNT
ncbi:MAG: TlpA family protein disulfide reductase [Gammaproteobacteria bacterium]|nr:TlpA family protein disulfide reductase [Gammaproteobacteria bacterium]